MASRTNELHYTAHLQPWLAATAWGDSWLMTALVLCPDFRDSFSGAGRCLHDQEGWHCAVLWSGAAWDHSCCTTHCPGHTSHSTATGGPYIWQTPAILPSSLTGPLWNVGQTILVWILVVKCLHEKIHFWNKNCSLCHKAQGGRTPIINDTAPFSWKVWYCHPK